MFSAAYSWISNKATDTVRSVLARVLKCGPVPRHVAIIMDGNRRFARKTHSELVAGHSAGEKKLQETLKWCLNLGVEEVTVFAFSIENFKRPAEEVEYLMALAASKCRELIAQPEFRTQHRLRVYGDISLLPQDLQSAIGEAVQMSKNNPGAVLNICLAYTSTHEISGAVKAAVRGVERGELEVTDLQIPLLDNCMYTHDSPPIDLLIRTSGEIRLSDFLLWQSASSCLAFIDVLWPEFSEWDLYQTVLHYQRHFPEMQRLRQSLTEASQAESSARTKQFLDSRHADEETVMENYRSHFAAAAPAPAPAQAQAPSKEQS